MTSYPAGTTLGDTSTESKGKVGEAADQAKQQVARTGSKVREQAVEKIDERKGTLVEHGHSLTQELHSTADKLRENGNDTPAKVASTVASQLENAVEFVESHSITEIMSEGQRVARTQPLAYVGLMFGAGFALSRLFKADSSSTMTGQRQLPAGSNVNDYGTPGYATTGYGTTGGAAADLRPSGTAGSVPGRTAGMVGSA